jgi:hypothetical protein
LFFSPPPLPLSLSVTFSFSLFFWPFFHLYSALFCGRHTAMVSIVRMCVFFFICMREKGRKEKRRKKKKLRSN